MSTFPDVLRRWMDGRSAEACALHLSVTPNTVRNWLAGSLPPSTRIPLLAAAMGVGERKLRQVIERQRHAGDGATAADDATVTQGAK